MLWGKGSGQLVDVILGCGGKGSGQLVDVILLWGERWWPAS